MRYGPPASKGKRDKHYVSEFTEFITRFLDQHPEEEEEQRKGRALYWDHQPHRSPKEVEEHDSVPDDRYGFDASAWRGKVNSTEHGS